MSRALPRARAWLTFFTFFSSSQVSLSSLFFLVLNLFPHLFLLLLDSRVSSLFPVSSPFLFPMHGSDFDDEEFDIGTLRPHPSHAFRPQFGVEEDTFSDYAVDPPARRHQLRSRPPIDFSQYPDYPSSHVSGSTAVHSNLNSFMSSHKPPLVPSFLGTSRLPIEAIASLTIAELCHNTHYCELRDNYDYVSRVLASYLGKDLRVGEPRAASSNPLLPNVYRGASY